MLLERVLENLGVEVDPFATCGVASGVAPLLLPTHSLAVVPPGLPHQLESGPGLPSRDESRSWNAEGLSHLRAGPEQEMSFLVVCGAIRAVWAGRRGLFDHLAEPIVVDFADRPRMREIFDALLAEQTSGSPGRVPMMAALMQQCLVELFRRLCGRPDCRVPWLDALEDTRLARALEAIHEAPERPHSLESLAREAAMSRSAFAARFRTTFGQSAMDYLRDVRLREAARLLRQPDLSVDVAATRAGFTSRSHFTRAFRRLFGKSPGEYRGGR